MKCMKEFGLKKGKVITFDYEAKERIENMEIEYQPVWRFLLAHQMM